MVTKIDKPIAFDLPDTGDLVLYPDDVDSGRGVYPLTAAGLVDEMAEADLDVRTWHDAEHTDWYGDREPVLISIVIGVISSAAWEGIRLALSRRKGKRVRVSVGYRDSGTISWVRAEGDAADVAEALGTLRATDENS